MALEVFSLESAGMAGAGLFEEYLKGGGDWVQCSRICVPGTSLFFARLDHTRPLGPDIHACAFPTQYKLDFQHSDGTFLL
jgi:hypothetical protein